MYSLRDGAEDASCTRRSSVGSATQVPWKNVVDTNRHPAFAATVMYGSWSTVASKSPA
jgi:hypothetical protein